MTFELYHPSGRPALGVRALPGTSTVSPPTFVQVLDWGNGEHISCRGPAGVCLVTAGSDPSNGWTPFEAELFLQYTDGRVLRLAHHRSSSCGYWVAPRASLSRDGRFVVFASDWDRRLDCGDLGRGDPYLIDLQAGATPVPTATVSPTPTTTTAICSADADHNGIVNIVDIQMRAAQAGCLSYLPLIASFWRTAGPGATTFPPPQPLPPP